MPFNFREVVISGSRDDTEGTAKLLQEIKIFMEGAGWITFDDQSAAEAGSHLIAFSSTGEDGTLPTFYMILASGTTAAQNSNQVHFQVATNWDAGAHDEGGGIISPVTKSTTSTLDGDSNGDFNVWMSGDSEGVAFITRNASTQYDSMCAGRLNQFQTTAEDPYPLYTHGANGVAILVESSISPRAIVGNPPIALTDNNSCEIVTLGFSTTNQPYDLGSATSIYAAYPLFLAANDITPLRQGFIGTLRNAWAGTGTGAGMLQEGTLIASGTDFGKQVYRAFTFNTTRSLIIRQE